MKKVMLLAFFILISISISAQWNSIQSNLPQWEAQGYAIDAYTNEYAVIAISSDQASYGLYKTTDGGESWEALNVPVGLSFIDVEIVNENVIIGCSAAPAQIWKSIDGGTNWTLSYDASGTTNFLNYIEMFDDICGVALGDAPTVSDAMMIYKTINGGETWESITTNLVGSISSYDWRAIDFIDINTGYYYEGISRKLYKTTNSGNLWNVIKDFTSLSSPTVIKFYDENIGVLCLSYSNQILKTTDGGQSWLTSSIQNTNIMDDIEFLPSDPMKLWIVSMNELFFSEDGGENWQTDPLSGSFEYGRDMKIVDNVGWFLCDSVYRNINIDRVTFVDNGSTTIPRDFILTQNYPNPFNPVTRINFQLPFDSFVSLKVYDFIGNEIATLINENKVAGNYNIEFNASSLASGVYFYKLTAEDFTAYKKMVLIK